MPKIVPQILMLLLPALVLAQSPSTSAAYHLATILELTPLWSPEGSNLDDSLYQISIKVGQAVYVTLAPLASPSETLRYAEGRQLSVRIGENTISWHDTMGQYYKSPIISRIPIVDISKPHG